VSLRAWLAAGGGALFVCACGLDTSGLAPSGDDWAGDGGEGGSTTDAELDASTDVTSPVDAAHDASPIGSHACAPTGQENCTNGVDDDCNGFTDCADPACTRTNYTCVPDPTAAGTGWSFAPLEPNARPGCPPSLTVADVAVNPTNLSTPATCSCSCSLTAQPVCGVNDTLVVAGGYGSFTCGTGFGATTYIGGACHYDPSGVGLDTYGSAVGIGSGGACAAASVTDVPAANGTLGETCSGETQFGKGCAAGQVCALVPAGFTACVQHDGATTCPAGAYTTANSVGTIVDSRSCASCTCQPTPTTYCFGTWNFYQSSGCTGTAVQQPADSTCRPTGVDTSTVYYSDTFLPSGQGIVSCGSPAAVPQPTGQASLTPQTTVCCN
jgi:hypothetical protein